MAGRQALGKGLSALIPDADQVDMGPSLFYCPIALIRPNPHQPRRRFEEESLKALADSIKEKGLLTPLLVSREGEGYVLIAGERRWRAAQMARLERVPVIVKEVTEPEQLELALVENLHREDLNPLEEAEAYNKLMELTGLTQEELAQRIGKDRSTISNALRILKLPQEIQAHILEGSISMGHARVLAGISDPERQRQLAEEVIKAQISVRELEKRAKAKGRKRGPKVLPLELRQVEEELRSIFTTKVELLPSRRGGKIVLHYSSLTDLQRLVEMLQSIGEVERDQ